MICLFFAAVVWGLNYFYKSEYFKVKNIDIQNNTHYKDEEVKVLIPKVIGVNIFEINKKKVEETIARELNWVKEAELRKIFPDKVIIKLDERKPYLKIVYKDRYFLMDSEGVVPISIPTMYSSFVDNRTSTIFYILLPRTQGFLNLFLL